MSILDATLARTSGASVTVLGLSKELGLDPAKVEKAIMVLTRYHGRGGNAVAMAAQQTGLEPSALSDIVAKLGGDAGLAQMTDTLSGNLGELGRYNFFKDLLPFG